MLMLLLTVSETGVMVKLADYPGSQQMEPLLQALRSESNSGRVLRKHIDRSSNVVCLHLFGSLVGSNCV